MFNRGIDSGGVPQPGLMAGRRGMKMTGVKVWAASAAIAAAVWPATGPVTGHAALADEPDSILGADYGVAALADAELGALRGGFFVAGDLLIEFGGVVRAYANDTLFYENTFNLSADGLLENSPVLHDIGEGAGNWELADAPGAQAVLRSSLASLATGNGVVLSDNGDHAALLHNVDRGRLGGYTINSVSGIDIRHEMQIDIGVNNYHDIADHALLAQQIRNITEGALRAAIDAAR